jgi:hypothetical protein
VQIAIKRVCLQCPFLLFNLNHNNEYFYNSIVPSMQYLAIVLIFVLAIQCAALGYFGADGDRVITTDSEHSDSQSGNHLAIFAG